MNSDNTSNSDGEAMAAQTAPAEIDSDQVHDAAGRLQASVSGFAQEDEGYQGSLVAVIKQAGAQLGATNAKVQGNRAEIEKLASRIRNYRS